MSTTVDAEFVVKHEGGGVDADRAAWLATSPQAIDNPADFRALTALYLSNLKATGWGKDLTPAQARTLAVAARATDLNPLLGEIVMLGGNPYVTEPGVMRTADRHASYDGYDLEPLSAEERTAHRIEKDEHAYKCLVYRKDRGHPIVGIGHASPKNVAMGPIKEHWLSEMAQKRAIERAHSRAFPPGLPLYDEQAMQPRIVGTAALEGAPAASDALTEDLELSAKAAQVGWTTERLRTEYAAVGHDRAALLVRLTAAQAAKTSVRRGGPPGANGGTSGRAPEVGAAPPVAPEATKANEAAGAPPAMSVTESLFEDNEVAPEGSEGPKTGIPQDGPTPAELLMSQPQRAKLFALLTDLGIKAKPERLRFAASHGVAVPSYGKLTQVQAARLIDAAEQYVADLHPQAGSQ